MKEAWAELLEGERSLGEKDLQRLAELRKVAKCGWWLIGEGLHGGRKGTWVSGKSVAGKHCEMIWDWKQIGGNCERTVAGDLVVQLWNATSWIGGGCVHKWTSGNMRGGR